MVLIKLYLDIDGVILGKNGKGEIAPILDIEDFLRYTKANYDCYWLSTHSRYNKEDAIDYLRPYFRPPALSLLEHIQPAFWRTLKTEAIDFAHSFIWIDDRPLLFEIEILRKKGCLRNWLQVDSYKNYHDLTVELLERKRLEILSSESQ